MSATKIEWADAVWNPVTGCTPISPGCDHCYARRMANRLRGRFGYPADEPFRPTVHWDRLDDFRPNRVRGRLFVGSMGDLFHEEISFEIQITVLGLLQALPKRAVAILLTKRPAKMRDVLAEIESGAKDVQPHGRWTPPALRLATLARAFIDMDRAQYARPDGMSCDVMLGDGRWPIPNVWLGVTAEDQQRADERIPILLQTPAAVRFVSIEPALGAVIIRPQWFGYTRPTGNFRTNQQSGKRQLELGFDPKAPRLDWVICGGETGPGARPMHPDWVRSLRDQCIEAGVPFFFKQWGEWGPDAVSERRAQIGLDGWWSAGAGPSGYGRDHSGCVEVYRVGKRRAGRMLDGHEWNQFPEPKAEGGMPK